MDLHVWQAIMLAIGLLALFINKHPPVHPAEVSWYKNMPPSVKKKTFPVIVISIAWTVAELLLAVSLGLFVMRFTEHPKYVQTNVWLLITGCMIFLYPWAMSMTHDHKAQEEWNNAVFIMRVAQASKYQASSDNKYPTKEMINGAKLDSQFTTYPINTAIYHKATMVGSFVFLIIYAIILVITSAISIGLLVKTDANDSAIMMGFVFAITLLGLYNTLVSSDGKENDFTELKE